MSDHFETLCIKGLKKGIFDITCELPISSANIYERFFLCYIQQYSFGEDQQSQPHKMVEHNLTGL